MKLNIQESEFKRCFYGDNRVFQKVFLARIKLKDSKGNFSFEDIGHCVYIYKEEMSLDNDEMKILEQEKARFGRSELHNYAKSFINDKIVGVCDAGV